MKRELRFPVTRYGHQGEFEFWMQGHSIKEIARRLKRSERSVYDWLHGNRKIPWWVPEILRLQHYEYNDRLRQMGFTAPRRRLAIATADLLTFPKPAAVLPTEPGAGDATQPETIRSSAR